MNKKTVALALIFIIFCSIASLGIIYIFDPQIMIGDKSIKEWICTFFPNFISTIEGLDVWTRMITIINTIINWWNSTKPPEIPSIPAPNITPPPPAEIDVWITVRVMFLVTKTETDLGCNSYVVPTSGTSAMVVYEFYSEKRCFITKDNVAIQSYASTSQPNLTGFSKLTENCWRKTSVEGGDWLETATLDIQVWVTKTGKSGTKDVASVVTRVEPKNGVRGEVILVVKTKIGATETATFKTDVAVTCGEHYSKYKVVKQEYWVCVLGVWFKTGEQWIPTEMTDKGVRNLGKVFESRLEVAI